MLRHTLSLFLALLFSFSAASLPAAEWQTLPAAGQPNVRHEAAFVAVENRLFLLGGRRIQPVDRLDPSTGAWTHGKAPELEIHHFQAVVHDGKVWLVGAMSGRFPYERPLDHIPIYDPAADTWSRGRKSPPTVVAAEREPSCTATRFMWWPASPTATGTVMWLGWMPSISRPANGAVYLMRRVRATISKP